jgi:hypothetical protein
LLDVGVVGLGALAIIPIGGLRRGLDVDGGRRRENDGGSDEDWKEEAGPDEDPGPDKVMVPGVMMPEVMMREGAVNEIWAMHERAMAM